MRRGRVGGVGLFRVEGAGAAEREEGGEGGEEGGGGGEGGAGGADDGFVDWGWDMIFWGTEDVCVYILI